MRRYLITGLALGCGVLLSTSAWAQNGPAQPERPPVPAPREGGPSSLVERMMTLDKNGDGKLSKDEVTEPRQLAIFERADANKDGTVTKEELTAFSATFQPEGGFERGRGPTGPGGREGGFRGGMGGLPVLRALDPDNDGEISAKEIENAVAALKALDKNGDGKLTREEIYGTFGEGFRREGGREGGREREREGGREGGFREGGRPGGGSELVAQLLAFDKNKDGKLTKEELPERMLPLLERADANKDGALDKEELTRYAETQNRGGANPRPEGRGEGREGRPPEQPRPVPPGSI